MIGTSAADANRYRAQPVLVHPPPDPFLDHSPHFAEQVRRDRETFALRLKALGPVKLD